MKCSNCGGKLAYEKPVGLDRYSYLCENCSAEYEIDMNGNIRRVNNFYDFFGDIFK